MWKVSLLKLPSLWRPQFKVACKEASPQLEKEAPECIAWWCCDCVPWGKMILRCCLSRVSGVVIYFFFKSEMGGVLRKKIILLYSLYVFKEVWEGWKTIFLLFFWPRCSNQTTGGWWPLNEGGQARCNCWSGMGEWYQTLDFHVFDAIPFAPLWWLLWAVLPSAVSCHHGSLLFLIYIENYTRLCAMRHGIAHVQLILLRGKSHCDFWLETRYNRVIVCPYLGFHVCFLILSEEEWQSAFEESVKWQPFLPWTIHWYFQVYLGNFETLVGDMGVH